MARTETIKKKPLLSSVIVTLPLGLAGAFLACMPTFLRSGDPAFLENRLNKYGSSVIMLTWKDDCRL